ncbi:HAD family acid phosphatase [Sphingosinicella terrae]|uniref:HAD family acid phosphatase n=1 Tax=Sphingosinicella terrae TaxID=2172047 RepID=UPI0025486641|nr:HAD family acid phosphatase [Sphingosinicella terrae]
MTIEARFDFLPSLSAGRGIGLAAALALAGCATAPAVSPQSATAAAPTVPPAMQWLYGSGESAASSLQAYSAFRDHVLAAARARPAQSVVLAPGSTLEAPRFLACGDKPLAVILDVDETAIQNLGYEYDEAYRARSYDEGIWNRWEQTGANAVAPVPGAVDALSAVREAGVTVIFNSNRLTANAAQTQAALEAAGLGPARPGETLWLKGDIAPGSAKDPRRAAVATRFCVIAMAGDQLGDFSDLFNAEDLAVPRRRQAAASTPFAEMWGNGWFMLSNPVYGPSLQGDFDDVFPVDRRWSDQGGN